MQRLRTQLEKAQGNMHPQELELKRLRPLKIWLGQNQREQQVSRMVGTYTYKEWQIKAWDTPEG